MTFQVRIQNLGKLADATVRVAPLTVLAGPNNTGKSFFSKAMYSVFDAMHANHAKVVVDDYALPLQGALWRIGRFGRVRSGGIEMALLDAVSVATDRLVEAADACSLRDAAISAHPDDQPYPLLQQAADELGKAYGQLKPKVKDLIASEESSSPFSLDEKFLARIDHYAASLRKLGSMTAQNITKQGLSRRVSLDLLENFQVRDLADLKKSGDEKIVVQIEDVGDVTVNNGDDVVFRVKRADLIQQQYSRVIYLESPVLWKLQGALESIRRARGSDEVNAVPGYFHDLARMMKKDYRRKPIIPTDLKRLASQVVRGKVVLEKPSNRMVFNEADGRSYPLAGTAMGIANLGVLAMLVERGVVAENSFLFIDEPEAHLHPKWQVEMAKLLFALAQNGVHVVIATHSVDIVKWLEVHVKEHPEDQQWIELNPFTESGVVNGEADFSDKLSIILRELTGPFHKLYMRGL